MQTKNVIIIGAGPAGLATAIELKKISAHNIIILEKNPEISYKICAGGIGPNVSEIGMTEKRIVLDLRGRSCPIPALVTGKKLKELPSKTEFEVLADDKAALKDIPAVVNKQGHQIVDIIEEEDHWKFIEKLLRLQFEAFLKVQHFLYVEAMDHGKKHNPLL